MTEREYRDLDIDSYSSIKMFLDDRKKYYKKFVLKEEVKEDITDELRLGSLTDCLLFTPEEYEQRYSLSVTNIPSGQYGKFVSALWRITLDSTNSSGEVNKSLDTMLEEAYNAVKFDKNGEIVDFKRDSLDTAKRKFTEDQDGILSYYQQLRDSYGKTIIELQELEKAQAIIIELKSNSITKDIVNLKNDKRFTVYNQLAIVGEISSEITKSVPFKVKCLIDKLVVDHDKKMIYIYDLKTAWDNEHQFQYNYFKYKYYLQAAIYFYLVVEWKKGIKGIEDYAVSFMKFIVAESSNYKSPLIYTTGMDNFNQGMRGFSINGRYYPGVIKAVQDLMWHKEAAIWNISKDNLDSMGVIKIRPFDTDEIYK